MKKQNRPRLRTLIDFAFHGNSLTLQQLKGLLRKEGVDIILRQNEDGLIYGMTYIDHKTKCVFNGSDLGKNYSAKAILERCVVTNHSQDSKLQQYINPHQWIEKPFDPVLSAVDKIIQPTTTNDQSPAELRSERKKKKRKRIRL